VSAASSKQIALPFELDPATVREWRAAPWRRYGRCRDCGELAHVAGLSYSRVRCLACFAARRGKRR
jgi:hypothetical protein